MGKKIGFQVLKMIKGVVVSNIDEICPVWRSFYSNLFTAEVMDAGLASSLLENPAEFYLRFWDVLRSDLTEVLKEAYRSGSLSLSQRSGLISLVYKKGDHFSCKNWCPITLLNVDYKLCARTLAGRLLRVLHFVVALDQT